MYLNLFVLNLLVVVDVQLSSEDYGLLTWSFDLFVLKWNVFPLGCLFIPLDQVRFVTLPWLRIYYAVHDSQYTLGLVRDGFFSITSVAFTLSLA
jgi:hypothetical protein